jgi:hypothetical protein
MAARLGALAKAVAASTSNQRRRSALCAKMELHCHARR